MRLLLLLGFIFLFNSLIANDTLLYKTYLNRANELVGTNIDKALEYFDLAANGALRTQLFDEYLNCKKYKALSSIAKNNLEIFRKNIVDFELAYNNVSAKAQNKEEHFLGLKQTHIYYNLMIGDLKKSLEFLKEHLEALKRNKKIYIQTQSSIINDLINIGNAYKQLGNYYDAAKYLTDALDLTLKFTPEDYILKFIIYKSLGDCELKIKNYGNTELYYNKALKERKDYLSTHKNISSSFWENSAFLYQSIAEFYLEKGQIEKSLQAIDLAYSYLMKDPNNVNKGYDFLISKGKILNKKKDFNNELIIYNKAQNLVFQNYGSKYYVEGNILLNKAKSYYSIGNIASAMENIQASLIAHSQSFNKKDWLYNPSVSDVYSKKDLLETLDFKSDLLLKLAQQSPQYLEASHQTAKLAAGLIDSIRADYSSDYDKQYLADWSYGVYEKTIETAYLLFNKTSHKTYINTAFNALERSKAITLLEALRTGQAESALSDEDRNLLYQYKKELQKLEAQIYDEITKNRKPPESPSVRELHSKFQEARKVYEALVKSFETRYPDYYRIKYSQKFAQMRDIQALLPNNGTGVAIEYFIGENAIYTFLITKTDCKIFKTPKPQNFEASIETLRNALMVNDAQN